MIRLQQGMIFLEGHIFHCCEGKEIVWPIENSGNHHAQHDEKIVCYGFIHLFHWHAYTMVYKCTHDATALSLCQSVVVKDLGFMGSHINQYPSRNFETLLPSNEYITVFALLKWDSSVGKLCGPIMANDKEYILQCSLSTPRRDSSFMKLGSAQPKSLSRPFVHQTFRTCKRRSCLFRPWAACQPNLQELANACQNSQQQRQRQQQQQQQQQLPLIQGNNTLQNLQSNKKGAIHSAWAPKSKATINTTAKEDCTKRCALPSSSSIVRIISRTSRKQHATTTNSCSVKPHALLRRLPNCHQDHRPPTKPAVKGWSPCYVLAGPTVVHTVCAYCKYE